MCVLVLEAHSKSPSLNVRRRALARKSQSGASPSEQPKSLPTVGGHKPFSRTPWLFTPIARRTAIAPKNSNPRQDAFLRHPVRHTAEPSATRATCKTGASVVCSTKSSWSWRCWTHGLCHGDHTHLHGVRQRVHMRRGLNRFRGLLVVWKAQGDPQSAPRTPRAHVV